MRKRRKRKDANKNTQNFGKLTVWWQKLLQSENLINELYEILENDFTSKNRVTDEEIFDAIKCLKTKKDQLNMPTNMHNKKQINQHSKNTKKKQEK